MIRFLLDAQVVDRLRDDQAEPLEHVQTESERRLVDIPSDGLGLTDKVGEAHFERVDPLSQSLARVLDVLGFLDDVIHVAGTFTHPLVALIRALLEPLDRPAKCGVLLLQVRLDIGTRLDGDLKPLNVRPQLGMNIDLLVTDTSPSLQELVGQGDQVGCLGIARNPKVKDHVAGEQVSELA